MNKRLKIILHQSFCGSYNVKIVQMPNFLSKSEIVTQYLTASFCLFAADTMAWRGWKRYGGMTATCREGGGLRCGTVD